MDDRSRLSAVDTCAISDALTRLGHEGVLPGLARLSGAGRLVGRVVTVELGPPSDETPARHLGTAAIGNAEPGDVIVVAHQGRTDCAGWGGNLTRAARRRGVGGVVVHGAVRDVDEMRDLDFSVFASAATPRTARGRAVERSWGEPVTIDGVTVSSGDWIVGDASGAVVIPAQLLPAVLAIAEDIVKEEAAIAEAIEQGTPVWEAMGARYERMLVR